MPSKKKNSKGKAKKKGASEQGGTPDAQMQRLKIDDNSVDENDLLAEAIKLAAAEKKMIEAAVAEKEEIVRTNDDQTETCMHGFVPSKEDTDFNAVVFATEFVMSLQFAKANDTKNNTNWCDILTAARVASAEKYPGVWIDPSKMKRVISVCLSEATDEILNGIIGIAQGCAAVACYIEEFLAFISGTNATHEQKKVLELLAADVHGLVKYLRERIPCNCLDDKYKKVKCSTKMGFCCNKKCTLPDKVAEQKSMVYCTKCRTVNYCSRECLEAAWPEHKELCESFVEMKAEFNSNKERQVKRQTDVN
eukprot:scaffold8854_cov97-Skeletonema_dohrnii-CCMP3373.AAC.2